MVFAIIIIVLIVFLIRFHDIRFDTIDLEGHKLKIMWFTNKNGYRDYIIIGGK